MPTEGLGRSLPLAARRVFRLALTVALSLAFAYGLQLPLPFLAPIFALMLTATPAPPLGLKGLVGLLILVAVTMGGGLLLAPVVSQYPATGLMLVALGLFMSNFLSVHKGKEAVGAFLVIGLTMITAAGVASFALALIVVKALAVGICAAVLCQGLVSILFPEDPVSPGAEKPAGGIRDEAESRWIAARATIIVFPAYLLALTNPAMYLPLIMKSVSLGQQSSLVDARQAGWELLGSTFLSGIFAITFWVLLGLSVNLWMFFLWMLLFGLYVSAKIYQVVKTRYPASYWINVLVTMLILLGPAVQDSANGNDVYKAFAFRMTLFVAVTLYAWAAVYILEHLRARRGARKASSDTKGELASC